MGRALTLLTRRAVEGLHGSFPQSVRLWFIIPVPFVFRSELAWGIASFDNARMVRKIWDGKWVTTDPALIAKYKAKRKPLTC